MSQQLRLPEGGQVDRTKPLRFRFDGREYAGYAGDTLASALLANGVRVTGRSFKYRRPRGIMAAGFEEANTLVQLGSGAYAEPNLKATQVELFDGLEARAVNCSPSARWDWMSILQWFKSLMPAGFYYKTFIALKWKWDQPAIRHAAGLGRAALEADPDVYDKHYAHCDVLVVGAGESGIAAAIAAAQGGADVLLMDDRPESWEKRAQLAEFTNIRLVSRATVFGAFDHSHFAAIEHLTDHVGPTNGPPPHRDVQGPRPQDAQERPRQRLWKIRARDAIFATGAIERPMVFPNNDRPGVMLAGAAREYLRRYGVIPGRRVVIATNNDSAYEVADALRAAGVEIVAIADLRKGIAPTDVHGAHGVRAVELHRIDDAGRALKGSRQRLKADALLVSGGWNPTVHLYSQAGGKLHFDATSQSFVPGKSAPRIQCVGAAAGELAAVARLCEIDVSAIGGPAARSWVDLASDVTSADLRLALRENFRSVEHVKRYTTTGMMTDQGKTSNVNAIGVIAKAQALGTSDVGTTRFRPPFNPVTLGAIAGRRVGAFYRPMRRLAAHDAHVKLGAGMEEYPAAGCGPRTAPQGQSEASAVAQEVLAVRNGVGLFDGSPLGKILVSGPDAAEFLHRIYVNNIRSLKPGHCRYGVMLGEDGVVMDDGICARLSEDTFLVGTTSGAAGRIADWLEEWLQCEWIDLDVLVEQVTTQWAVSTVTGPKAREVLQRLGLTIDLDAKAFPHMAVRVGTLGEACPEPGRRVPVRIMRVSFTGELSYEISVPFAYGRGLWDALLEAGGPSGIAPFGIEAMMALRTEKGYLHVGTETDGTTLPQDVGFAPIIEKKAEDFVGRRSTMTPDARRADRKQFVGLVAVDGRSMLPVGGHVVGEDFAAPVYRTQGWVTSSVMSPTLQRPVALAVLTNGRGRLGEQVFVYDDGRLLAARVVEPAAWDPKGERVHA